MSLTFLWASLVLAGALTVWVWNDAVGFAACLGGAAVPFIGFAMIVPVGSLLVFSARQTGGGGDAVQTQGLEAATRGYPVVIPLLVLAVLLGLVSSLDNHEVRKLGSLQPRPDFKEFVESWSNKVPAPDSARPVIVATAGGGLRAAYWTATVLGRIQDQAPDFRKRLLAISGVSGGSLGATVFVTLLGQSPPAGGAVDCRKRDEQFKLDPAESYECAGQTVLSHDFLGPTVAALLFTDLMQRFAPLPVFPDRARGLEQGWEQAWQSAGYAASTWSGADFQDLWRGEAPLPALLLNGTHVETGRRVITSNVRISREPFADTYDFFDMTHASVRPSTAAHNSARFTYVSPAGTLRDRRIADNELKGDAMVEARRTDGTHIVDGGYFENFGAVTVRQALRAALAHLRRPGVEVRPIVILVSNDPKLQEWEFPPKAGDAPRGVESRKLASEVLSPLRALLKTRDARGLLAVAELWNEVRAANGDYFQFRLCPDRTLDGKPGRADPALGWVLSQQAEALMREQLRTDACGNASELKRLMAALKPA